MNQKFSVLLINDDSNDVDMISQSLAASTLRHSLTMAEDGEAALTVLRSEQLQRPYIVLLDLHLPKMDGFTFLKELRNDPQLKSSVVFVVTGSDDDASKRTTYHEGIAGYLTKDTLGPQFLEIGPFLAAYSNIVEFPVD